VVAVGLAVGFELAVGSELVVDSEPAIAPVGVAGYPGPVELDGFEAMVGPDKIGYLIVLTVLPLGYV
jgi:hypothetical protein